MQKSIYYSFTSVIAVVAAIACLTVPVRTDQAPGTRPTAGQPPAGERMPRAGVDPNGVITGIATRLDVTGVSSLRLRFEAGARTIWHTHVGPQLLLVEEGKARVQERGGKIIDLGPTQTIYLPPNIPHWHGAAPDSSVTMLSLYPIGSQLERGAEVTESEYLGKGAATR